MELKERIKGALANRPRKTMPAGPKPAAVLIPLYMKNDEYHILFTKRTQNLNHHRGEISFPGGSAQPEDRDLLATALRETWEEVGIDPVDVRCLGVLDDFYSIYGYLVTPYVGICKIDKQLQINTDEIDHIIEVPISHLIKPEIFRTEDRVWSGQSRKVYYYHYQGEEIWGLTAAILKQFLDLVF